MNMKKRVKIKPKELRDLLETKTVLEVAEILGVNASTLYSRMSSYGILRVGKGKSYRTNGVKW